jgi:hypothetical protein
MNDNSQYPRFELAISQTHDRSTAASASLISIIHVR